MAPLQFLLARRSVPALQLGAPGPSPAQIDALLQAAMRVPDHGKLKPWRLILLEDQHRREFGRRLYQLAQTRADLSEAKLAKDKERYEHAPLVVVVVVNLDPAQDRIPAQERVLSAGCIAMNLLLGAESQGYKAQWLTGWAAYDRDVAAILHLAEGEHVIGFIHIGTAAIEAPERERPTLADKVSRWTP